MQAEDRDLFVLVEVAGFPLTARLAAAALGWDEERVLSAGERLTAAGVLAEEAGGFVAAPGAAPSGAGEARRASLSGRLADALAASGGDGGRVGRLLIAAGRREEAAGSLAGAAFAAEAAHHQAAAAELAEEALAAQEGALPAGDEGRLWLIQARFLRSAGRSDEAAGAAAHATRLLSGPPLVDALGYAAAVADDRQRPQEAERLVAMAEAEAARLGEAVKLGSLLTFHGRELSRLGFAAEADAAFAKGGDILAEHGSPLQRFLGRMNRAWALLDRGQARQAEAEFALLRDRAADVEGEASLADKEAYWARALFAAGRPDEALAAAERALAQAGRLDLVGPRFIARIALAEGGLLYERFEDALAAADGALEVVDERLPAWENVVRGLRARALAGMGRREEAAAEVERALAATPAGPDGWRLRRRLEAVELEIQAMGGPAGWPQTRAEDLTDELLQAEYLGPAVELMTARAGVERDPELALQAAALALQVGNPMQAAAAVQAGDAWKDSAAPAAATAVRGVAARMPEGWIDGWRARPAVAAALAAPADGDEEAAELLRTRLEAALGAAGLAGIDVVLSPAQRRAQGLVRRRRRPRRTGLIAAAVAGIVVLAGGTAFAVSALTQPETPEVTQAVATTTTTALPTVEETEVAVPEERLFGISAYRGDEARTGTVPVAGIRTLAGRYWVERPGGFFGSEPVAYGRNLYVASSTSEVVHVLDQSTGKLLFSAPADAPLAAAPVVFPGGGEGGDVPALVFVDEAGTVYAQNGLSGDIPRSWTASVGGRVVATPVLANDALVIATLDGRVVALERGSGEVRWQYPAEGAIGEVRGAPAYRDGIVYVTDGEGLLHLLDAASGAPVCDPYDALFAVVVPPIVAGGAVYVGTDNGPVAVIAEGTCGSAAPGRHPVYPNSVPVRIPPSVSGEEMYVVEAQRLLAIPLAVENDPGAIDWVFDAGSRLTAPPLVAGDVVYVGNQDGVVFGVDAATGEELWRFRTGSPVQGMAAVAGGLFVTTAEGAVWAIAGS